MVRASDAFLRDGPPGVPCAARLLVLVVLFCALVPVPGPSPDRYDGGRRGRRGGASRRRRLCLASPSRRRNTAIS